MVLFKYFKYEAKGEKNIHLLAENSPLSQVSPFIVIKEANQAVTKTIKLQGKHNPYLHSVDNTKMAEIAVCFESWKFSTVQHFSTEFTEPNTLKEGMEG